MKRLLIILIGVMLMTTGCTRKDKKVVWPDAKPPVAREIPHELNYHGEKIIDNYFWLRERDNPEVIEYLKAENAYTEKMMEDTKELQEKLFQEMKSRIKETDLTVPVKWGDYYYYSRTQEGKQYPILCRKYKSLKAPEEVYLDENKLAEGHRYFRIGASRISPNHRYFAYAVDTTGGESYTLYIKDLKTGEILPEKIDNISYGLVWANDNQTIFYTTLDDAKRPFKLFRHKLGTSPENDQLVYHEQDSAYYLRITKTRSQNYILMNLESEITTEVRYLDANNPEGDFKLLYPRKYGVEYYVDHHDNHFYIRTNEEALNFKLVRVPVDDPVRENWEVILPHRKDVMLNDIDLFKNYLVLYERENGLKTIRIQDFTTGKEHPLKFPEEVYSYRTGFNPEYDTDSLRFTYYSLVTPRTVYDYNMKTRELVLRKQYEVLGGYNPEDYESKRLFARAKDGTSIPISIVYRKGIEKNGKNPLYLYGYGSYGASIDPYFSTSRISLLDRGFIYAIAHIRGGGEMGRAWYENGKLLKKKNTFEDFIACAEYLINERYTSPEYLVISGGSAGGLLMGAVTNMRPDLFKVVIAKVPFVDVVNTMMDPTIPLTVIEYDEWGNPNKKEYYDYIKSYSPYDNVQARAYPNMLITAGLNDPRVQYWEPAKWTARLRAMKTNDSVILLKTNMGAGHGGASGRYDYLREIAFEYAFILKCLGMNE